MSDTLTIIQPAAPLADPHVLSDHRDRRSILGAIYEGLVRRDGAGFAPALARAWRSDDQARVWTFELRAGVRFHDGSALEAADVIASLERALAPDAGGELGTQGVYRSYLAGAQLSAPDSHSFVLAAPAPFADLLDLLADIPVAPRAALATLATIPVGSGPYRLDRSEPGRVELAAFDGYWGGAPAHALVVWLAEPDPAARLAAVAEGRADIAAAAPHESAAALEAAGARLVTQPSPLCVIFMANCQAGPCADARVRQALNCALDVPALMRAVGAHAERLSGPLTRLHLGWDPETPPYPHDPERARALLAEAGHAGGLAITIDVPTSLPDEGVALARGMAEAYARVGVRAELRLHEDRPAYADMVRAKQIGDLCCFDSSPLSTYRVLREKIDSRWRGPWWEGYASPAVDALIDQAAATPDDAARQAIYRRAYRIMRDDAPWVFLYHPTLAWAVGPRAHGWSLAPEGRIVPG